MKIKAQSLTIRPFIKPEDRPDLLAQLASGTEIFKVDGQTDTGPKTNVLHPSLALSMHGLSPGKGDTAKDRKIEKKEKEKDNENVPLLAFTARGIETPILQDPPFNPTKLTRGDCLR
jgi:hypothetical protein